MSNQRPGKMKPAAMNDSGGLDLVNFFKYAKEALEAKGEEDAAFYFEQCEDFIRAGGSLSDRTVSKALGL